MDKELEEMSKKIDKILEIQELILSKLNTGIHLPNELEAKIYDKKLTKKEERNLSIEKLKEDIKLKFQYGPVFKRQFNLVVEPSVERIRAYLRTNNPSAFDGLKRN